MRRTIGMIVPTVDNFFFSSLVREVGSILREKGYRMIVCDSSNGVETEKESFRMLSELGVAGVVCISGLNAFTEDLLPESIPLVWVDRRPFSKRGIPWVANDDQAAMEMATDALIKRGCRNILLLPGFLAEHQESPRVEGYRRSLEKHGLPCRQAYILNRSGERSTELEAEALVSRVIHEGNEVDGIITSSDRAAFGAITALRSGGLYIPEDVKLISFDNSVYASLAAPGITCLDRNPRQLAQKACETLEGLIEGKSVEMANVVEVSLIKRDSIR